MGDNKSVSKSDSLRNLFGSLLGGSSTSASTSKDAASELASGEDYRKSNQTLVIRNCQLKSELSKAKKEIDSLRFENESLRGRLVQMETATDDEKIEMIVQQRIESRVKQLKFIVDRNVKFLQKTSEDLAGVFGDLDNQQENNWTTNERKSTQPLARKPALSKLEESPLRRSSHPAEDVLPSVAPLNIPSAPQSETSRVEMLSTLPRRGKSPLRIRPRTPKKERGSTPTPSSPPPPFDGIVDSVRRKRSATLKIQSFKEPSLGTKLRRPAGFDPMGNQCCAFKGKEENVEDAYARTSMEHMSIERMAEDRVKKTTSSSSASASERRKSEDKATNEEATKEEMERAVGGLDTTPCAATMVLAPGPILNETPKRPPLMDSVEIDKNDETRELNDENGGTPNLETQCVVVDDWGEEEDVVGDILPSTYDMRPIRPLPTPLRKVDITPNRRIEMFCDERGRVRRNEKILRYLDDKRKLYENNCT